jgi:SAM-dependent methyltransferase
MSAYRERILGDIERIVLPLGPLDKALDFGSGDGFFAEQWARNGGVKHLTAVDVVERPQSRVRPQIYDGNTLPFADRSFDLVYSVDVLHHCADPFAALRDMARCSSRYLLIKDHTFQTAAGRVALGVLDEIGNRRFGIPSPYHYQERWSWVEQIESSGWKRLDFLHPMRCHAGLLGALTNRLQFIGAWERIDA